MKKILPSTIFWLNFNYFSIKNLIMFILKQCTCWKFLPFPFSCSTAAFLFPWVEQCVCVSFPPHVCVPQPTAPDGKSWIGASCVLFLQFHVRSDRRNNYTLVIPLQTLPPFITRPRCFSLDFASPIALIYFPKGRLLHCTRMWKKSWKRVSKIWYLLSLLLFLCFLFFLYFAIGFLIKYLDKKSTFSN